MDEFIATCKCGDTEAFAKDAFHILFPNEITPQMVSGRFAVKQLAQTQHGRVQDYLEALVRSDDKFAYYVDLRKGEAKVWDLRKGSRIC